MAMGLATHRTGRREIALDGASQALVEHLRHSKVASIPIAYSSVVTGEYSSIAADC